MRINDANDVRWNGQSVLAVRLNGETVWPSATDDAVILALAANNQGLGTSVPVTIPSGSNRLFVAMSFQGNSQNLGGVSLENIGEGVRILREADLSTLSTSTTLSQNNSTARVHWFILGNVDQSDPFEVSPLSRSGGTVHTWDYSELAPNRVVMSFSQGRQSGSWSITPSGSPNALTRNRSGSYTQSGQQFRWVTAINYTDAENGWPYGPTELDQGNPASGNYTETFSTSTTQNFTTFFSLRPAS